MIAVVPDLPFSLPPVLNAVMTKLGYWLYLALFYSTGESVLISPEAVFAAIVALACLALMASIAVDIRQLRVKSH